MPSIRLMGLLCGCLLTFIGFSGASLLQQPVPLEAMPQEDTLSGFEFPIIPKAPAEGYPLIPNPHPPTQLDAYFTTAVGDPLTRHNNSVEERKRGQQNSFDLFRYRDYNALEGNAKGYQGVFSTVWDGTINYEAFINWLGNAALTMDQYKTAAETEKLLNTWKKTYPKSLLPYLVQAAYHQDKAWQARGGGDASTVSAQGLLVMTDELNRGMKALAEAKAKKIPLDAQYYTQKIWLENALSQPSDVIWKTFMQGIEKDPDYLPLYRRMATVLLYRWRGDSDDLRTFARWAADYPYKQELSAEKVYAVIAETVAEYIQFNVSEFKSYGFSWPLIRQGFIQQGYQLSSYRLSEFCWMAVLYRDAETSRFLFDMLKGTGFSAIWGQQEAFEEAKRWAENASKNSKEPAGGPSSNR
jgi:hypothetical protein